MVKILKPSTKFDKYHWTFVGDGTEAKDWSGKVVCGEETAGLKNKWGNLISEGEPCGAEIEFSGLDLYFVWLESGEICGQFRCPSCGRTIAIEIFPSAIMCHLNREYYRSLPSCD